MDKDTVMTAREVALYLRISEVTVYKLANEGKIPAVRVGRCWRFRIDLIDRWFERRQSEEAAA